MFYLAKKMQRGRVLSRMVAYGHRQISGRAFVFRNILNICSVLLMCHGRARQVFSSRARPITSPIKRA